ncbi:MAG: cell division protein FtsZ, partial [Lachnospiraceae bacterium]|nr:cell division protein FtsZ [Lachnospiraceae bacterium]
VQGAGLSPAPAPVTPVQVQTPVSPVRAESIPEPEETPAAAPPPRPATSVLNRPAEVKSKVEPKNLKIPDFLQKR